jgi:hypothetical protein
MVRKPLLLLSISFALITACNSPPPPAPAASGTIGSAPAASAPGPNETSELVYIPIYSSIFTTDAARKVDLTVTLAVRNTDIMRAITLRSVRYFDGNGKALQAYVSAPRSIAPMAAYTVVIPETDTRAGVAGSFLVEWSAAEAVSAPVIEAVMIGVRGQQGISFLSHGRVLRPASRSTP